MSMPIADSPHPVQVTVSKPVFPFDNSFARELEGCYVAWQAEIAPAPKLLRLNRALATELGLDVDALDTEVGAAIFSGSAVPAGASPLAQAYAGHQFGGFNPQLGDGRALLLGELIARNGERRDIALKGSGRTPFSRRGDGKAALGPILREYLIGEAMHALGIPTTRALAATLTGQSVFRELPQPGAVLTRVAASHLRVGTFEFFAARNDAATLHRLVTYALHRHYPTPVDSPTPALALLQAVANAQAALVARWMNVGFIHGVMNTDNMTISGETIDYGPCAFMDACDPATVYSSIDMQGRYAYGNQPGIAQWNLARLAEALLPVMSEQREKNIAQATEIVNGFMPAYQRAWLAGMQGKLGLSGNDNATQASNSAMSDQALATAFIELLSAQRIDFTLGMRALVTAAEGDDRAMHDLLVDRAPWASWSQQWRHRMQHDTATATKRSAMMKAENPVCIPRNHLVEEALEAAAQNNDMQPFEALLSVCTQPFDESQATSRYALPPVDGNPGYRTFCGT